MVASPRLHHIQQTLIEWFRRHGRDLPWRRTRDPYRILVSEIMLQQTQVDRVLPKYHAFISLFPTVEALAAAAPGDVIRAWAGLGYNRRALNLQRSGRAVIEEHGGTFPDTPEALRQLPGIGPYTAGALACFAFERDVAFMDTNIRRVIRRVFTGPDEAEPQPSERELLRLAADAVPLGQGWLWNQAIMELGAMVCATRPRCGICPLRGDCQAYQAWRDADENVFDMPQPASRRARKVAERAAPYGASNRFFRGRVVDALRPLPAGATMSLCELGPRVKEGWTENDAPWLRQVVRGLAEDGLIVIEEHADGDVALRLP